MALRDPDNEKPADRLIVQLQKGIASDLAAIQSELLAIETAVRNAGAELDGEELIHLETRELLDELVGKVQTISADLTDWAVCVQESTEEPEMVALIGRLINGSAGGG